MAICNVACTFDLPEFVAGICKEKTRKAGIRALLIMQCSVSVDLTDIADVATAITDGSLMVSPIGLGNKPLATSDSLQLTSCQPAQSTHQYTHTVGFKSAFIDAVGNTDFGAYNDLILNASGYKIVLLGCDDMIYPNPDWTALSVTEHVGLTYQIAGGNNIAEDGTKAVQMYELTLSTYLGVPIIPGIAVPGLSTALGL